MKKALTSALMILLTVSAYAKEYTIGLPIAINKIDPYDLTYLEETEVYVSVYDTLFVHQVLSGYEPVLAKSWEFNKKNNTITFHLKPNLKFSDASMLTSEDVAFTYKRLIALDKDGRLLISKCLPTKHPLTDPNQEFPLIKVPDPNTVVIGPTKCGESLLKEMNDPTYGIISKKHISKNLRLLPDAPVSGAFNLKKDGNNSKLTPNLHNWRWTSTIDKSLTIRFKTISDPQNDFSFDAFRTSNDKIFKSGEKNGFNKVISVPIMVWYLTSENSQLSQARDIFKFINRSVDKDSFSIFQNNSLETPASSFFPNDFNCDIWKKKELSQTTKKNRAQILIINHPSNESKIYNDDLYRELSRAGYKVTIDTGKQVPKDTVRLYIRRQFFGDGTVGTLNFAFRTIRSIPDTQNIIIPDLEKLDLNSLSLAERNLTLHKICKNLLHYNHAPIAHRKLAFLFRDKNLEFIFSKANGNLLYNNLIRN